MGASGDSTEPGDDDQEGGEDDSPPQPAALRRQQRQVAMGGSVLAGIAVTIIIAQRFPEYGVSATIAGIVSGIFVYKLAANSIFPAA